MNDSPFRVSSDTITPKPALLVGKERAGRELAAYLREHDLNVTTAADGAATRALVEADAVDLVLLDLNLRGGDGLELARRLREASPIPIVILGGPGDEADRLMALEFGADEYVTKLFSARALLARMRALLRRRALDQQKGRVRGVCGYRFGAWELNVRTRQLLRSDGRRVALSNREFSLLLALLGAGQRVVSRARLIELSRLHDDEVYDRAVDVQIMRLRRKLQEHNGDPRYILTVRGAGYQIGVPVQPVY